MELRAARVAETAGIAERAYQEYDKREPGVRTAIRIAKSLKVESLDEFYAIWETQNKPDGNQTYGIRR